MSNWSPDKILEIEIYAAENHLEILGDEKCIYVYKHPTPNAIFQDGYILVNVHQPELPVHWPQYLHARLSTFVCAFAIRSYYLMDPCQILQQ